MALELVTNVGATTDKYTYNLNGKGKGVMYFGQNDRKGVEVTGFTSSRFSTVVSNLQKIRDKHINLVRLVGVDKERSVVLVERLVEKNFCTDQSAYAYGPNCLNTIE
ncbi:hypothetical protein FRX31_033898, partial [Thalictrum thalictroides]